jgi:hypothetical protein
MNRRHFLQSLLAVPALTLALAKKPEAALCKCGKPMPAHLARLTPEDFQARYIRPAALAIAAKIDEDCLRAYLEVNRQMDEWYGEPVGGWNARPVTLLPPQPDQVFIASGGRGYILTGSGMGFSELEA